MNFGRIQYMYGDKPPLYTISAYALWFGYGWLAAQYDRLGLGGVLVRALGLSVAIYYVDATIKGLAFMKENLRLSVKLK